MNGDNELEDWKRQWQSQPAVPVALVRRIERQTVGMRQYRWLEKLVTVFMGCGTIVLAWVFPTIHTLILAVGTWIFIGFAWAFALKHTRGLWEPSAPTTAAYLDLAIRRCRWKIADSRYDSVQSALLITFVFILDYYFLRDLGRWDQALVGPVVFGLLGVVLAVVFVVYFERKRRRAQAELQSLLAMQQELEEAAS